MTTPFDPGSAPSVLSWLRRLVGGQPADGRLRSTVKAVRALAVHVALGNIDQASKRLRQDRRVVVMCATGVRSRSAARHLRAFGFDAASLSGGIGAWQCAGGALGR